MRYISATENLMTLRKITFPQAFTDIGKYLC